jgi:hypothetical protein
VEHLLLGATYTCIDSTYVPFGRHIYQACSRLRL